MLSAKSTSVGTKNGSFRPPSAVGALSLLDRSLSFAEGTPSAEGASSSLPLSAENQAKSWLASQWSEIISNSPSSISSWRNHLPILRTCPLRFKSECPTSRREFSMVISRLEYANSIDGIRTVSGRRSGIDSSPFLRFTLRRGFHLRSIFSSLAL